jgi:DHA1 family tetracycline resistance protein-like MFS transporter
MTAPPPRQARLFIFLAVLIDAIGFGIIIPVLPDLIVALDGHGLGHAAVVGGYLAALFAVMQILCGPLMGNLSDRFGRRPVLLICMAAFGLDFLLMAYAPSLVWLFLGRAVSGITGAIYGPANAYLADITPPEKRAAAFGMVGAAFGAGFVIGPAIGGLLADLGPRAPFFAAAALASANALYGYFALPETLTPDKRRRFEWARANPFGAFRALTRLPGLGLLAGVFFLWMLAGVVYPATWPFYARIRFAWGNAEIGWSLAYAGATMVLAQALLIGPVVKALGERKALMVGLCAGLFEFAASIFATEGWMIYPIWTVGAFSAVGYASINALLSQRTSESEQGELQGALASLTALSEIAGPLLMTQTLGYFSSPAAPVFFPGAVFVLAAALTVAALLLALSERRRTP